MNRQVTYVGVQPPHVVEQAELQRKADAECAKAMLRREEALPLTSEKGDNTLDRQLAGLTFKTIFRVVGMVLISIPLWAFLLGLAAAPFIMLYQAYR